MKISAVSNINYAKSYLQNKSVKHQTSAVPEESVNFKGGKGAIIGAGVGLAYLGVVSLIAGPFLPVTLGIAALCGGTGALAGHNIQEEFKDDDDDKGKKA